MSAPVELSGGVRLLAPIRKSITESSWRAEDPNGSPLVVRFIELLHQDDYGGSIDARPKADEAGRAAEALSGLALPTGILPWIAVRVSPIDHSVSAIRPYLSARLWDVHAQAREGAAPFPPAGLKAAFVRLGRALDALHETHPNPQPRVVPNNLLTDGEHAWLADWGLDDLLAISASAYDGPRRVKWDPINDAMANWFPGEGAQRTQAELARAYFSIRTGVPLFGRDVKSVAGDVSLMLREHQEYQASGALRLDPLTNEAERACLARALSADPDARFASCAEFALNLPPGRIDEATLDGLVKQMIANLSDPELPDRVEKARAELEEELMTIARSIGQKATASVAPVDSPPPPDNEPRAPQGKFRVIGQDRLSLEDAPYRVGDYDDLEAARAALRKSELFHKDAGDLADHLLIYDDRGRVVG